MGCFPHPLRWLICIGALSLSAGQRASAQRSPQETLAGLHVPADWQIELYASEPMITNPTAIDVDSHGRVWVCEGQWYRSKAKTPPADCVKVLEDTDGDGKADKATTFADGLLVPMSVAVAGTHVYVGESPNLWVYEDKDGDLKADPGSKKVLLTGFGGYNSDHGLHGLMLGPDHWLYMTHGDPGFDVTGPDGSRAAYRWGAMMRCQLDGTRLEAFAVNFRNPYELTVDSFGNVWCSDNDSDGDKAVRICWVLDGGNYGWYGTPMSMRSPDGTYDPQWEWRTPIPGHIPAALITGFGSPAGIACYESDLFGSSYQNALLHADAGPREVRAYRREPYGAGFLAKQETLVTGDDNYFRPVDVCVGPDGSIYVADWYDQGVGGHAYNNPNQGRIYRIRPKGVAFQRTDKPGPYTNHADAMDALASPNLATQFLARERLIQEGPKAIHSLEKLARAGAPTVAARALWLLDRLGAIEPIAAALKDQRPEFRALAVRILRRHQPVPFDRIVPLANDPDVQVRREVLLALRPAPDKVGNAKVEKQKLNERASIEPGAQARGSSANSSDTKVVAALTDPSLLALIRAWDGQDRFYLEAIGVAAGDRGPDVFKALKLDAVKDLDTRTIKLIQILHPPQAAELLAGHLGDEKLDPAVANAIVDALGWMTQPQAMRAVTRAIGLKSLPLDARKLAIGRIASRLQSDYRSLKSADELRDGLQAALAEPDLRVPALSLIGEAKFSALDRQVVEILLQADDETTRTAAIEALGRLGTRPARVALARTAEKGSDSLQKRAIQSLAQIRAYPELEKLLTATGLSEDLQRTTVKEIAQYGDGCLMLFNMIDGQKLQGKRREQAIRLGLRHPDVNVRQIYARFSSATSQPATIAQLDPKRILALTGDRDHGQLLFMRGEAKCTTCHRVGSEGKDVGPDLTLIGKKYGPEAMLDQILRPAAAVAPEFEPYVLDSLSHGFLIGFVLRKSDKEIEFKASDGQHLTIPASDVQSLEKQPGTVMPDLLLETFKERDVADLLAYLCNLKLVSQSVQQWLVIGPYPSENHAGYDVAYEPEQKSFFTGAHPHRDNNTPWKTYKPVLLDNAYVVELDKLTSAGKSPAVTYLYTSVKSPLAQSAVLEWRSSAAVKVMIDGQVAYDRHAHAFRPAAVRVPLELKAGPNALLLKLESAGGEGKLVIHFETAEPVEFALPRMD